MTNEMGHMETVRGAVTTRLHSHWKFFLIEGIVLLLLGIAAICAPPLATFAVELLIGWILLLSGVVGLAMTVRTRGSPGFGWSLLSALIGIAAGAVLLIWPLSGAFSLTLILTIFLAFEGIVSVMYAFAHRRERTPRWGMLLLSGIVDLLLAALIFSGLPATAAWAIGLLVGINMVLGGSALISMALQAKANAIPAA